MSPQAPKLLGDIIEVSLQLLERLSLDINIEQEDSEKDLLGLTSERDKQIKLLFSTYSQDTLIEYKELLSQMSELDLILLDKSTELKNALANQCIELKKNKKAVHSYQKY